MIEYFFRLSSGFILGQVALMHRKSDVAPSALRKGQRRAAWRELRYRRIRFITVPTWRNYRYLGDLSRPVNVR
jgi:hypothetical protein